MMQSKVTYFTLLVHYHTKIKDAGCMIQDTVLTKLKYVYMIQGYRDMVE